ncbi:MAG TPA: DEAD/DEAH box helicase, partial [Hyphomicrobiales bacterium]|nr:DEAD/DEAH box helicase [Hyphomicrobiales bacterium]
METKSQQSPPPENAGRANVRPAILNPLFAAIGGLEGVGPRYNATLSKLIGPGNGEEARIVDLLWHFPSGLTDRRAQPPISQAAQGQLVTLLVRVKKHHPSPRNNKRAPYRVICEDDTGEIELIFFHTDRAYIERQLPVGETRIISGRVDRYDNKLQMPHPDFILPEEERHRLPNIEPVYPLSQGLSQKLFYKLLSQVLARLPHMPEWLDSSVLAERDWPAFGEALRILHRPENDADVENSGLARQRLATDELFAGQMALALMRLRLRRRAGRAIIGDGRLTEKIVAALPFSLTGSQQNALTEIASDMVTEHRMLRLLQGDVGSGKTVVALLAMARAVEAGAQAVLMAPTEILARQHLETLEPLCEAAGIRVALLTGREKGKKRAQVLAGLEASEADIAVGTHALFQDDVVFN